MAKGSNAGIVCGICCLEGHPIDACPNLQGGNVNAMFNHQLGSMTLTLTLIMRVGETTLILDTNHLIHLVLLDLNL